MESEETKSRVIEHQKHFVVDANIQTTLEKSLSSGMASKNANGSLSWISDSGARNRSYGIIILAESVQGRRHEKNQNKQTSKNFINHQGRPITVLAEQIKFSFGSFRKSGNHLVALGSPSFLTNRNFLLCQ